MPRSLRRQLTSCLVAALGPGALVAQDALPADPAPVASGAAACGTWRRLAQPSAQYHEIALPRAAFAAHLGEATPGPAAGLRVERRDDIRVYAVDAAGDTLEAPYVWRPRVVRAGERRVTPLTAGRLQYGVFRYTFEVDSATTLAALRLVVAAEDFDARVRVEGAQRLDAERWEVIARNARIAALDAPGERIRYTQVRFPRSRYRFYRVSVTGIDAPVVEAAAYTAAAEAPPLVRYPDVKLDGIGVDRVEQTTTAYIGLARAALISEVELFASDTVDFARTARLEAISDTVRRPDGTTVLRSSRTTTGTISSFAPAVIEFARPVVARHFRLTIDDGDDRPLRLDSVSARGPEVVIAARFAAGPGAEYFLAYGCDALDAPRYDLARYRDRIPESLTRLEVGRAVMYAPPTDEAAAEASALGGWWVYVALAGVAALLGWVALRLMR